MSAKVYWEEVAELHWQAFNSEECEEEHLIGDCHYNDENEHWHWALHETADGKESNEVGFALKLAMAKEMLEETYAE